MKRLFVHVEGETEEGFVDEVLRPHLIQNHRYTDVSARIIGNARQRDRRGGIRPWRDVRRDIVRHLRRDSRCIATTMVDYYGLPTHGERGWPGRARAATLPVARKAQAVESAMAADVTAEMDRHFAPQRFVPFVVMHEFEALLFSDCHKFAESIGHQKHEAALQQVRDQFETPEEINDSPTTAPSKRVIQIIPAYQKPLFGALAALEIGLPRIRAECRHFHDWLTTIESL